MDRIVVEVDDIAAKKWRYASDEKKDELNSTINLFIQKALDKSEDSFKEFLDKVGKEAQKNGLTENILTQLLNEE